MNQHLTLRPSELSDSRWIKAVMDEHWGGEPLVIRAKKYYPSRLNGIIAEVDNKRVGVLFYNIAGSECEIIVFEVFDKFKGIGTQMLNELKKIAVYHNCKRIFLMTTNDNVDALRFYQKRDFTICAIHINSIEHSRKIKPAIGYVGDYGIPVRDEIDLELILV